MKKAADITLSEVRKKINDVKQGLAVMDGLNKLRQVRKAAMESKGTVFFFCFIDTPLLYEQWTLAHRFLFVHRLTKIQT